LLGYLSCKKHCTAPWTQVLDTRTSRSNSLLNWLPTHNYKRLPSKKKKLLDVWLKFEITGD
jgi:hypothetical protein